MTNETKTAPAGESVCKGCWELGSACGKCSRCIASKPKPEIIRMGAPYDNPAFEALCREYGIWGKASATLCAVFWRAADAREVCRGDAAMPQVGVHRGQATVLEADARAALTAQAVETARINATLIFVERWANHHGTKPHISAKEALSCIQHHPAIRDITRAYSDGKVPETRDPYAEIASLTTECDTLRKDTEQLDWMLTFIREDGTHLADERRNLMYDAMMSGLEGRDAVDFAMTKEAT